MFNNKTIFNFVTIVLCVPIMEGSTPKLYPKLNLTLYPIGRYPIIEHTLQPFNNIPEDVSIIVQDLSSYSEQRSKIINALINEINASAIPFAPEEQNRFRYNDCSLLILRDTTNAIIARMHVTEHHDPYGGHQPICFDIAGFKVTECANKEDHIRLLLNFSINNYKDNYRNLAYRMSAYDEHQLKWAIPTYNKTDFNVTAELPTIMRQMGFTQSKNWDNNDAYTYRLTWRILTSCKNGLVFAADKTIGALVRTIFPFPRL